MVSTWTGGLLAAIAVALVHAFHLGQSPAGGDTPHSSDARGIIVGTLAIVLPPFSTAFLGIRAMYNFRGRSRTYGHERGLLHGQEGSLEALVLEAKRLPAGPVHNRELDRIDFEFRAVALRTEQSLSLELEQWMLLMERWEPEVSS